MSRLLIYHLKRGRAFLTRQDTLDIGNQLQLIHNDDGFNSKTDRPKGHLHACEGWEIYETFELRGFAPIGILGTK